MICILTEMPHIETPSKEHDIQYTKNGVPGKCDIFTFVIAIVDNTNNRNIQ